MFTYGAVGGIVLSGAKIRPSHLVASATLDAALPVLIQRMKICDGSDRDAGTRERSGVAAVTEKKMSVYSSCLLLSMVTP